MGPKRDFSKGHICSLSLPFASTNKADSFRTKNVPTYIFERLYSRREKDDVVVSKCSSMDSNLLACHDSPAFISLSEKNVCHLG